jgi:hypothetical protein
MDGINVKIDVTKRHCQLPELDWTCTGVPTSTIQHTSTMTVDLIMHAQGNPSAPLSSSTTCVTLADY